MTELIDIGVNLTHKSFNPDRDQVIEAALAAGLAAMVITGTSEHGSREAQKLAATRPGVLHATAGVHPHHAQDFTNKTLDSLRQLAALPEVVALGECGLDFNRNFSPRDDQERCFEAQLELAAELGKPLFLHQRDAHPKFIELLSRHRADLSKVVVHCFTGTGEEMDACLDLGCFIGITGWICDERRGLHLRELVQRIPADKLMLETDGPFLLPRTIRPKPKKSRNEPKYLTHVLQTVAECLDQTEDQVAATTTRNARNFFALPH